MSTPPPPESLHVVEGLDHLEVQLPPDLRPARFVYWIYATPPPLVMGAAGLASSHGMNWALGLALFSVTTLVMVGIWKGVELTAERVGRRPLLPLGLVFLLFASLAAYCTSEDLGLPTALAVGAGVGLLHAGLLWLFSKNRATLRLDQHSLQVRRLWTRLELPLEDLDGIDRIGQVFPRLYAGGRPLPASGDIDDTELAWLDDRVQAETARRRRQLHSQGQDPSHQPSPPPELLARLDRS